VLLKSHVYNLAVTTTLTVICGPMFSGKTEELIRQVHRAGFAGDTVQIFKPVIDNRWGKVKRVRSHAGGECDAVPIRNPKRILKCVNKKTHLVAIDEVQFFKKEIVDVIEKLLNDNIKVIVAGLPTDFRGEPFGQMPTLLAKADRITSLTAICTYEMENGKPCGFEATRTQRLINGKPARFHDPIILIGAAESYAARCPNHHMVPGKPNLTKKKT
jgi:thymidine kinase